jgi:hypothetical protein
MPAGRAPGGSRVERFLSHLDALSDGREPEFWPVESTLPGVPGVTVITYPGVPEPDLLTSVTYGVSLVDHEEWHHGAVELCLCVRSGDRRWGQVAASVAEQLRGRCPFVDGDTLDVGEPIAAESPMDAFVVHAPLVLDPPDGYVDVGDGHPVRIRGLYPVHRSERTFIIEHGVAAFWRLGRDGRWDPYDVTRRPAV